MATMRRALAIAASLLVAACATTPEAPPAPPPAEQPRAAARPPAPPPPPPKPAPAPVPPTAPEVAPPVVQDTGPDLLRKGVASYDDGDYKEAARQFNAAIERGLPQPVDQASARKYLAFIACGSKRISECRTQFRWAFEADRNFDLTPAEAGHPTWGPVFRSVKAEQVKKQKRTAAQKAKPKPKPTPQTQSKPKTTTPP